MVICAVPALPGSVGRCSRRGVGTSVFAGMIGASTIGIFLIPMLYVVFQRIREIEWRKRKVKEHDREAHVS